MVQPSFRQTPWAAEAAVAAAGGDRAAARIAFVSESGTCRCVLAAAAFRAALAARDPRLAGLVEVECRATKDYCLGDGPELLAARVASELGLELAQGYAAQQFKESRDIVDFDLVLVMDKFTAADVLREVGGHPRARPMPCPAHAARRACPPHRRRVPLPARAPRPARGPGLRCQAEGRLAGTLRAGRRAGQRAAGGAHGRRGARPIPALCTPLVRSAPGAGVGV